MLVSRKSDISGKVHVMHIPQLNREKLDAYLRGEFRGKLIQNIFPELNADQREFILTGITPKEWSELFAEH